MRQQVKIRVDFLVKNVALYLQIVDRTWKAPGPYSRVAASARAMAAVGNLTALANNQAFLDDVAWTLKDWHAYGRPKGFKYPGAAKIGKFITAQTPNLAALRGLRLDSPALDVTVVAGQLLNLIAAASTAMNPSGPPLVGGSKLVHCLLPDLIPPIDRYGTGWFFGWGDSKWTPKNHAATFNEAFPVLQDIARRAKAGQYVTGTGWQTSVAKVVDNAIVAMR